MNLFDLRWVAFDGIRFSDHNDLFHCELCQAYGVDVLDNVITDTQGAGIGVNAGYNVVVARNHARR